MASWSGGLCGNWGTFFPFFSFFSFFFFFLRGWRQEFDFGVLVVRVQFSPFFGFWSFFLVTLTPSRSSTKCHLQRRIVRSLSRYSVFQSFVIRQYKARNDLTIVM